MRKCWVSPVGPRCALRYTSYNVQRSPRNPQSAALSYVRSKKTVDTRNDRVAQYGESNYFHRARSWTEKQATLRQTRVASEMTRRPWRDFVRAHYRYLCAYTRISSKCNTGSRAFNCLAHVAMIYVLNTYNVRHSAKRMAYEIVKKKKKE